ncbi:MAG: hypothetical protein ABFD90_09500 [Phycisphaerales bacterium]
MIFRIAGIIVSIASITMLAAASDRPPRGDTYAMIVSGIGKDPEDRLARDQIVRDFSSYLQEGGSVKPNRLTVLVAGVDPVGASTADRIAETIRLYASPMTAADRFVFYYAGQANAVGDSLRFNLPGPDVTQEDLARWLAGVKAGVQLVVLDCPYAAVAAKALARPGRVVVLASTAEQAHATRFGMHFVPALGRAQNDTNQDGSVSVLEAFAAAAREIEKWYQDRRLLPTETPSIEDNCDGRPAERPWRYEQDGGDGRLAAGLVLAPKG